MTIVFVGCAAAGGTILVLQFLLALVGLGGHAFDGDVAHDFGGDFYGDVEGDFHMDHAAADGAAHHGSTWFFGVLTFRTVVASLAFFGLAGLAAQSAKISTPGVLLIAASAGATAMFGVYWLMQGIRRLRAEGTVRIQWAVGRRANVYLRIPAARTGSGKIQIDLQNRTMEYLAVTSGPEIPTGTGVVVVSIVDPTTLEVRTET